jgi:cellulose synthase/poly-beta-1,6-N-acetylglucosamine synthase-like glycosyltransferase
MELTWYEWALVGIHLAVSLGLLCYGLNWYAMLVLLGLTRGRTRSRQAETARKGLEGDPETWPQVLIQLPVYNEKWVARRVIEAACSLDYPSDKLEIQVLDDSSDETSQIIEKEVALWRGRGIDIQRLTRTTREGYKAGALKEGMKQSRADFIGIFDADFIPGPDWIKKTVPFLLADSKVGLAQTRWGHLNREDSLITRIQAVGIDGHFAVEQPGRIWGGFLANFNGTAGMWRRQAIEDAGGWEGDTLTEDLDLSYRSQMKGWRIEYLVDVQVPAELPDDIRAIKSQQFRWAKGSIQVARKLLWKVWTTPIGLLRKLQATVHLTTYMIHPLMLGSVLLSLPMLWLIEKDIPYMVLLFGTALFALGFLAPFLMYFTSQIILYKDGWKRLWVLPGLLPLGMGIAVSNTKGVWQALKGQKSAFIRTPKRGSGKGVGSYRPPLSWSWSADIVAGVYSTVAASLYASYCVWPVAALLGIYAIGFVTVGLLTLRGEVARRTEFVEDVKAEPVLEKQAT